MKNKSPDFLGTKICNSGGISNWYGVLISYMGINV